MPRAWVEPAPDLVKMLWSDAGASGKPGSLWAVGTLQLLAASQGNQAPGDKAWKLKSSRFQLGDHLGVGQPPEWDRKGERIAATRESAAVAIS